MILTITMNPSVDISYSLEQFTLDTVNRVSSISKTPGGKGVNVTRVLSQLGDEVVASGILGGKMGEYIENELSKKNIKHCFYKITDDTRNCLAILHDEKQTEILEQGPMIKVEEAEGFLAYFESIVPESEMVVISGSLPKGLDTNYYSYILDICLKHNVSVIVDCSGKALFEVLKGNAKPTAIKPNAEELYQLLGVKVTDNVNDMKQMLQNELFDGVEWVIVSLGSKGAFAKYYNTFYKVLIPEITVINPVGSGDSTVAGITSAIVQKVSDQELLKKASVLGMLNVQERLTGYVNLENYDNLFNKIEVIEV